VIRQPPLQQSPVAVETGTLPAFAETVDPAVPSTELVIDRTPMTGAQLAYISAPAPKYPGDAARAGAQGTVLLKVLVDIDGTPLEVTLERSSGNRSLDRAAREQVLKHWRFQPAVRNGRTVQAYGLVPIDFSLQ
jgi:protein TonB